MPPFDESLFGFRRCMRAFAQVCPSDEFVQQLVR